MSQLKTEIGKISYNPATSAFEALVTFHFPDGPRRLPASCSAGLDAEFNMIADGLLRSALANFGKKDRLQSSLREKPEKIETPCNFLRAA
ncbi:hypothetical protein [Cognatishimia sp. F0-27]|uniref:hypothetical protein n=1 Tax=Cognatishimia sp. F0-27 TaxID=2816855 RepID=UPI001D0C59A0|nr:hypothetical protein [Cognatishimia sp. F0-27]MCC1492997.1 hypothetical protein [Cognatishimia sp. F0-27]